MVQTCTAASAMLQTTSMDSKIFFEIANFYVYEKFAIAQSHIGDVFWHFYKFVQCALSG